MMFISKQKHTSLGKHYGELPCSNSKYIALFRNTDTHIVSLRCQFVWYCFIHCIEVLIKSLGHLTI